jgi:hypothetical protein
MSNTILSLDPSSTVCGYAVLRRDKRLMMHGLITPACRSDGSYDRVMGMADDLGSLLDEVRPGVVLVEWTKGKVGRRHGGLGAGLAVYGCGVGGLAREAYRWCRGHAGSELVPVLENDWTRGQSKEARTLAVAGLYPQYRPGDDPGGDAADAIGLAVWWLRERMMLFTET